MEKPEFLRLLDTDGPDFDRLLGEAFPQPDPVQLARLTDEIRLAAAHRPQGASGWKRWLDWCAGPGLYYAGSFAIGAVCAAIIGHGGESTALDMLFSGKFSAIFGG